MMTPCVSVKVKPVWIDTQELVRTVTFALERIGHDTGTWPKRKGPKGSETEHDIQHNIDSNITMTR